MFGLHLVYISLCVDCPVKICKITVFSSIFFGMFIGSLMRIKYLKPRYDPFSSIITAQNLHSTDPRFRYAHGDHGVSLNYSKLPQTRGPGVKFCYLYAFITLSLRFCYPLVALLRSCCAVVALLRHQRFSRALLLRTHYENADPATLGLS